MGLISGILGNTPLATSGMKGAQSGQYGQSGIVGTIVKMYLGGALGGALGGGAGQGASGLEGAMNGMGGVTDGLGSMGSGGLGGLGGNIGGGLGDAGASLGQGIDGSGMMGAAGDFLQNQITNSGSQQQPAIPQMSPQMSPQMQAPQGIEGIMAMMQRAQGNPQQQDNGLMNQPGIPDFFRQMTQGWQR